MKAVLYSINRPHTDNIKSGRKLWEIRKSKPNIPVPFPAFIYETKKKGGCGKVIGEFVCDEIKEIKADNAIQAYFNNTHETCLTDTELRLYATKGKPLYGLHISKLKIYDKPKEINEFRPCGHCLQWDKITIKENIFGNYVDDCYKNSFCTSCCKYYNHEWESCERPYKWHLTRPPQSWCYVEAQT